MICNSVCVTREPTAFSSSWTHEPGTPVPVQLAGHIDAESWTKFLKQIVNDTPKHGLVHPGFMMGWAIAFFGLFVFIQQGPNIDVGPKVGPVPLVGLILWLIMQISLGIGYFKWKQKSESKLKQIFTAIVHQHQESMSQQGITLSYESVKEWHSSGQGGVWVIIHWFQLIPAEVQAVAEPVTVVCPEGASEGQQIQFQTPDGRTVMASVPPGVSPGQQFQVQAPAAPAEATVVTTGTVNQVVGKASEQA